MAERMSAGVFTQLMNRFYREANRVLIESDAMVDKLVGDEVIGLYLPSMGAHATKAIKAAQNLLRVTGHADSNGPWVPVGVGVHTGVAYVGAVGSTETVTDFTAMGDAVNVAARLAKVAGPGEILISDRAYELSGLELGKLERQILELKGRTEPISVRVLRVTPAAVPA
jgi:adenylate cyclase